MTTPEQRSPDTRPIPEVVCPRCGTPAEPDQEYCLVCGLRLGAHGHATTRWLLPAGREPAEWVLVVIVALIVAAAGAALAIVFSRSDGHSGALVATTSATSVATPSATIDTTAVLPTEPTATQPTQPTPQPKAPRVISWPGGTNGYTVILNSIPRTPTGRATALAQARQALKRGLPKVGILDSSKYSSLHPGYWVVFSGVYPGIVAANAAVPRARSAGYAAYERQIAT
jgi:hypothetical protein